MRHPHNLIRWWGALRLVFLLALPMALAAPPARADACGAAGQRACNVDERIPSCDVNLVEAGGTCVRPNCGAEGQRLCSVIQRTTFNWILMAPLPVPQPCDINLRDVGGLCKQPTTCGREGQPECGVLERIPSCDLNLVASGGRCAHPPLCGRLGQQPCPISARGPALRCDANLVAQLGQCTTAGAVAGNTAVAGQPVTSPTPSGGGMPPPPPAPRPASPAPAPAATATPPSTATAAAGAIEANTDRMGGDIYGFDLAQADPAMCQASCAYNGQCVAWTYVKPGIKGPAPRCFLKGTAAAPTPNTCCVSGAKIAARPSLLPRR